MLSVQQSGGPEGAERAVRAWNQYGGSLILGGTDGVVVESELRAEGFLEMARVSRRLSVPR